MIMVTHDVKILPRLLRIGEVPAESIADALTSRSGGPSEGYLEIYEICLPLITIKKCLSASSQQIISAQAMQYCRQID
ncbi:MAG: hypothetical protein RLZZ274_1229, partial [Cyanobacteriota bacterium]